MKKFEIRKDTFHGKIDVLYNAAGSLEYINFGDAEIADELKQSYKKFIPVHIEGLARFKEASQAEIIEVSINITFDSWYNLYNLKRNKDKALAIWNKIPQTDHVQAFYNTKKYLKYCVRNSNWYNQMYPDTYLRSKHYHDEWDKI